MARDLGLSYNEFVYDPKKEQIIHKNGDNWDFSVGNLELVSISTKIKQGRKDSKIINNYLDVKDGVVGKNKEGYDIIAYNGLLFRPYHINRKTYECVYYMKKIKKNEICVDKDGIIHKKDIALHRYKFEREIGKIPKGMVVHHIDGNSLNNDTNNFALLTRASHTKWHSTHRRKAGDVSETSSK